MLPAFENSPVPGLCLRVRFLLPLILIGLLLPSAARSQVSYTGSAATQNFGSQAIGSTSAATTFSFSVAAGTTVGSIAVVTQGAPNLDFTEATGGTCAAQDYASATTCSVDVTFAPKFAGLRKGAVVFFSAAGNTGTILGSVPVYGIGSGPQITYSPSPAIAIEPVVNGTGLYHPNGAAVDGAGDLFIADEYNFRVVEVPAGGGAPIAIDPTVNGKSLAFTFSVAVDGAGDLFIADFDNGRVLEVSVGGGAATAIDPTVNGAGLSNPVGVAVDGAGDLFIDDANPANTTNRIVEVPAGGGPAIAFDPTVNGKPLSCTGGVAVDAAGDIFIGDNCNDRVVEIPAGGGAAIALDPTVDGRSLYGPVGEAVDGVGDLFITDSGNSRIVEIPANGGAATAFDPKVDGVALNSPWGVGVDGAGNLFIADFENERVVEVQRSQPPALKFATVTDVGSTDTADGTLTVQVQNAGNSALNFEALSYPADFSEASGDSNACTSSASLRAGQECNLPVEFTPEQAGALSEDVTLTDNALNVAGAKQSIVVSGTGLSITGATHFSVAANATVVAGTPFSITVKALTSSSQTANTYDGTVSFTSSDPLFVNLGPLALSSGLGHATVTLNTPGIQTITATDTVTPALTGTGSFLVNAVPTALTLPTPGSALAGPSVTFTWTAGTGATEFDLWLGFNGAGSSDLYSSGVTTATSASLTGLQTKGVTIYARLYYKVGGVWNHNDYTYTEAASTAATMISPSPGATLGSSNVTFSWTAGTLVANYALWLGTSGPGSSSLYASPLSAATSVTVPKLPARGTKIYARLYSEGSGGIQYVDYTYTEQ